MPNTPLGRFVWHELLTTDPAGAADFYPRVTGWTVDQWRPTYKVWKAGDLMIGGAMELPAQARQEGAPPHWLAYVSTPDVDETVANAQGLGATLLVGPKDEPEVGRWAILNDPQGAMFAVYRPLNPRDEPLGAPTPGEFSWHELVTTDHEAGMQFYATLFGWQRDEAHDMGPMGTYILFSVEGWQLGGMYNKPAEMPAPPHWMHYVKVASADEAAERIKQAGGQVIHGPMEVPGGDRVALAVDPQGAHFAVHSSAQ